MPYVDVEPNVRLFVHDSATEGRPIVFLHGWPSNSRMFEYQFITLPERGFRAIGIDLRGYGKSDQPEDGLEYDRQARDVVLAGFSMGGAIALHVVARWRSARIAKLALIGAAAPCVGKRPDNPDGVERSVHDGFLAALRRDRPAALAAFNASHFASRLSPEQAAFFQHLCVEASPRATLRGVEEIRDRDLRDELERITIPTVIFHGVHDAVIPFALSTQLRARIPSARFVAFEAELCAFATA